MGVSINTRQAYSEIDEFLGLLDDEQINKIPLKLREFFKKEKDSNYKKVINPNEPIKSQNLKEETLGLIALLNLQYWCEDEQEKERLKRAYAQNERVYQEMLQIAFNPDDIFKKRTANIENKQEQMENTQMIEYKESFIKKLISKIKKIFFR